MSDSAEDRGTTPVRESMLQRSVKVLENQSLPLEVGRFEVDGDGFLRAREVDQPLAFRFSFRGFDFDVVVENGETGPLQLKATLGLLPFTAESGSGRRIVRGLFAAADTLNRGRLVLSERGEITIEATTMPPKPRTTISIMAAVAALLLEAKPYIELLAEALRAGRSPQPDPR